MRNSGCEVPDYMLSLKKANQDERKKLMAKAPKLSGISTVSKYEKEQNKKKEDMIAASKKRKSEGKVKKVKNKKMKLVTGSSEMDIFLMKALNNKLLSQNFIAFLFSP